MKTKTISLTKFAGRVGMSLGEIRQWKHPERVDGFVVERGRFRVDMEAFDRALRDTPRKTRFKTAVRVTISF